jgi:hypothetical protein
MTWRETWLKYFPDWPPALLDRFELPIRIELYKYDGSDDFGFVPWWQQIVSQESARMQNLVQRGNIFFKPNVFNYALFNGGPAQYQQVWKSGAFQILGDFISLQPEWFGDIKVPGKSYVNNNVTAYFDSRLWQWPIWFYATANGEQVASDFLLITFTIINNLGFNAQPYDGADTIFALHENGVNNGAVDYGSLADFIDYRNAYSKYGQQIAAQKAADAQQQKNDLRSYETELADKLQAEKNALQNLTLSMRQAMKNEAASAERDMVNTVINAQNLKLSLLAAMR